MLASRFTLDFDFDFDILRGNSSTASKDTINAQRINLLQLLECACFLVFTLAILIRICVQNCKCCKKQQKQHREKPVQEQEMGQKGGDKEQDAEEKEGGEAANNDNDSVAKSARSVEMSGGEEQSSEMTNHNLLREMSLEGLGDFYHRSWNELQ